MTDINTFIKENNIPSEFPPLTDNQYVNVNSINQLYYMSSLSNMQETINRVESRTDTKILRYKTYLQQLSSYVNILGVINTLTMGCIPSLVRTLNRSQSKMLTVTKRIATLYRFYETIHRNKEKLTQQDEAVHFIKAVDIQNIQDYYWKMVSSGSPESPGSRGDGE